jgi:hypothetical protein
MRNAHLSPPLQSAMAAGYVIDVMKAACESIGLFPMPEADHLRLVIDHGAPLISRNFGCYLEIKGFGHIHASPYHSKPTKRSSAITGLAGNKLIWSCGNHRRNLNV